MKPRIYKFRGLWYCALPGSVLRGFGFAPADAYEDWRRTFYPWRAA
jgi:hypothetical protein